MCDEIVWLKNLFFCLLFCVFGMEKVMDLKIDDKLVGKKRLCGFKLDVKCVNCEEIFKGNVFLGVCFKGYKDCFV